MRTAWQSKGPILLLALVAAGCASGDAVAPGHSQAVFEQTVNGPAAEVLDARSATADPAASAAAAPAPTAPPDRPAGAVLPFAASPVPRISPGPTAETLAARSSSPDSTPGATASPMSATGADAAPMTRELSQLHRAAQNSPFNAFGHDVFDWDEGQLVVLKVPADHEEMRGLRYELGYEDGDVEDTEGTRLWVQECARHYVQDAASAPVAVSGAVTAEAVYSCLGGLAHMAQLLARYWWTEAGLSCVANAVASHSLYGDDGPAPLAVCPSIGYDPAAPRTSGWLARKCSEITADHPNPRYPDDPSGTYLAGEALPSCWPPIIEIVRAHAAEAVDFGHPDSPHHCFHAFLGYVWARQTGRESRPPDDLAVGCGYRAFEARP